MRKKNMNGDGSLSRRKDGRYQVNVWHDGKMRSFYGRSEKEVMKKFRKFQAEREAGLLSSDVKVASFMESWLINNKKDRVRPSSYDRLMRTYSLYVRDEIGEKKLATLTPKNCQALINKLAEMYSYSTVKKVYELLTACFRFAVATGDLQRNPMGPVTMPREAMFKKHTREITIPTTDEFEQIMKVAESTLPCGKPVYYPVYTKAYRLIAETGVRVGELLGLTWSNISFEERTARIECSIGEASIRDGDEAGRMMRVINEPKTKSGYRVIILNSNAVRLLCEIQDEYEKMFGTPEPSESIIVNSKGKFASEHGLQRTLKTICDHAGISGVTLHVLRHYFASKCIAYAKSCGKEDIFMLSKHLGHSRPSITMDVYAHVMDKQKDEFRDLLESI